MTRLEESCDFWLEGLESARCSGALCAGAVALFVVLLAVCAGSAKPAGAAAEYISVPGDADTIQAAVDSAESGAEIRVQGGEYFEHVVISKSVRISGSWNADFSVQDTQSPTILKGGDSGRPLTVYMVDVTPTVVMSYMVIMQGNASGLGGAVTPTVALVGNPLAATAAGATAVAKTPQAPARGRAAAYEPGGAGGRGQAAGWTNMALGQLLSRLDAAASGATSGAGVMAESAGHSGVGASAVDEIDCGGGIYVRDAYLHLILVNVSSNMASSTGTGAGGGICAVNLPSGGLQMERVTIANNTASQTGYGYGGGLFYSGGETPAAGALAFQQRAPAKQQRKWEQQRLRRWGVCHPGPWGHV